MSDFSFIPPTSVATIPGTHVSAAFTTKTSEVFKEENDIAPIFKRAHEVYPLGR